MIENILARRPILATVTSASGYGVTELIHHINPFIQFGIGIGSLVVIILTAIIKFREVRKK